MPVPAPCPGLNLVYSSGLFSNLGCHFHLTEALWPCVHGILIGHPVPTCARRSRSHGPALPKTYKRAMATCTIRCIQPTCRVQLHKLFLFLQFQQNVHAVRQGCASGERGERAGLSNSGQVWAIMTMAAGSGVEGAKKSGGGWQLVYLISQTSNSAEIAGHSPQSPQKVVFQRSLSMEAGRGWSTTATALVLTFLYPQLCGHCQSW